MTKQVVLSFDDSCRSHYKVVFPLLQVYGCVGIFGVITQRPFTSAPGMGWSCAQAMHQAGHALVSHTHTHPTWADPPDFEHLPATVRDWEIAHSVDLLKSNRCFSDGFIYPASLGTRLADVQACLQRNGVHWALLHREEYDGTPLADMARDPFHIARAAPFKRQRGLRPSEYFRSVLDKTVPSDDRLAVFMFHGVEDDGAWDNISTQEFVVMLQYIKDEGLETVANLTPLIQRFALLDSAC